MLSLNGPSISILSKAQGTPWKRRQKELWEVQDEERCEVLGFEHDMAVVPVYSQINQTCTRPLRNPALQHAITDGGGASKVPPLPGELQAVNSC